MSWIIGVGVLVVIASLGLLAWKFQNRLTIKQKLLGLSMAIGIASVAAVGVVSINRTSAGLLAQQEASLDAIRASRQSQIEDYFGTIHEQMRNFSQNLMITQATAEFAEAFGKVAEGWCNVSSVNCSRCGASC